VAEWKTISHGDMEKPDALRKGVTSQLSVSPPFRLCPQQIGNVTAQIGRSAIRSLRAFVPVP